MTDLTPTYLNNGQRVVSRLMKTRLGRVLSPEQAEELWQQCKATLNAKGLDCTVAECEESDDGSLDTLPRGDVLDALGKVLVNEAWPLYATPAAQAEQFAKRMCETLDQRQYAKAVSKQASSSL